METQKYGIAISGILSIVILFLLIENRGCNKTPEIKKEIITKVETKERPVYIKDTIRIKTTAWKTKDTLIFLQGDSIPCGDTSFIAQADSVITPSGDTIHTAFSYYDRKGNFSLVFKPRPDSIITREIIIPLESKEPYPYGVILGALGIGFIIGAIIGVSQ
jgi:hypothetical protein